MSGVWPSSVRLMYYVDKSHSLTLKINVEFTERARLRYILLVTSNRHQNDQSINWMIAGAFRRCKTSIMTLLRAAAKMITADDENDRFWPWFDSLTQQNDARGGSVRIHRYGKQTRVHLAIIFIFYSAVCCLYRADFCLSALACALGFWCFVAKVYAFISNRFSERGGSWDVTKPPLSSLQLSFTVLYALCVKCVN